MSTGSAVGGGGGRRRSRRHRRRLRRPGRQLGAALSRPGAADRPAAAGDRHRRRRQSASRLATGAARRPPPRRPEAARASGSMIKVYISSVIDAPADAVWARVRDFNGLPQWHPAIADQPHRGQPAGATASAASAISTLRDGGTIREQLLACRTTTISCTYSILEWPMGVDELHRHAQADAGHRRQPHLRRMVGRVRCAAGPRAQAGRVDRPGCVPGRLRRAQAAISDTR